ncbi:hypothetical protein FACS1894181_18670 [Bacteroidia bacterium]|nr:hypothetical protein FACS1894181_18670 [Bacteroidia bacterium]
MKNLYVSLILLPFIFLLSCRGSKKMAETQTSFPVHNMERTATSQAGPPTVVYKTIADFDDYVPMIMNGPRTEIVSYPGPADVGDFSKPTHLKDGYLLDNRGISEHVVFLRYTYAEYSRLPQVPSLAVLEANILEKYPLKELIYCGVRYRYKNIVEDLNALVDSGFAGCRRADIAPRIVAPQ